METRDECIEQIASCLGMTYEDARAKFYSFANLGQPALNAAEAMNNLNTAMESYKELPNEYNGFKKHRKKVTNYTKPKNRKKKSKY